MAVQTCQLFAHGKGPHKEAPQGLLGDDPTVLVAEAVQEDVHGSVDAEEEVRDAEQFVHPFWPRLVGSGPLFHVDVAR